MTGFLIRTFVRDHENTKDPKVREAYGKLAGGAGMVLNALLAAAKVILGWIFGSVAIMADGINNVTDAASSLVTLFSFKLAGRPADKEHPYGHARIEYIAGLMVSFMALYLGIQLLITSVKKILAPEPTEFSWLTLVVLVMAILAKFWQSRFYIKLGTAIKSATIKATGAESRNDVISTAAVLIGVLVEKFTGLQIDGWVGALAAAYIIYSGIELVKETSAPLLGELPDEELVEELKDRIMAFDGVIGIHDLMVHNYGPGRIFASVHVEVSADSDILHSHDLMDNIERTVGKDLNIHLVCHMDPLDHNDPFLVEAATCVQKVLAQLPCKSSVHDLRVVTGPTHKNIVFDVVVPHEFHWNEEQLAAFIDEKMKEQNSCYFTVVTVDRAYIKE
ncbi:MAG: cation transporter [Clostridiales bacterium]|nr:cation transporter [Clostridiales bacterium]